MDVVNDSGFKFGWFLGRVPPQALSGIVLVKGTFRIMPGGVVTPLPEAEQENVAGDTNRDDDKAFGLSYSTDFAFFKPGADLILTGSCYTPGARPVTACPVRFGIGSWSKALVVAGDRIWKSGRLTSSMTDPEPFTRKGLGYENAYGGPGHAANPIGKGTVDLEIPGVGKGRPVANVQHPDQIVVDPKKNYEPAGFGPYPMTHPWRMSKVGTFDAAWMKENWPWFPADFDWTFFNAAPADQQLKGFLAGNESIRLENLHPDHPKLETTLPGLRPRWFLNIGTEAGGVEFREVPLNLDTLQIDTDRQVLHLVWRGVTEVRTKKMKEITDHYIVAERLSDPPLSLAHYRELHPVRKKENAEEGKLEDVKLPSLEIEPIESPSLAWVDKLEKEIAGVEKQLKEHLNRATAAQAAMFAALKARGKTPPPPVKVEEPKNIEEVFKLVDKAYAAMKVAMPEATGHLKAPTLKEYAIKMPAMPDPPKKVPPPEAVPAGWTRDSCAAHAAARGKFDGEDLSKLDLSGLDLKGLSFDGAVLAGANLAKANLAGANLARAILAGANLGQAVLAGARLEEADLTGADLSESDLTGAVLDRAELNEVKAAKAILNGVSGNEARLHAADLSDVRAVEARFHLADFDAARLDRCDLTRSDLSGASFDSAEGSEVCFIEADVTGVKAAKSKFPGGKFTRVKGDGSVWEEAVLDGADFSEATLVRANFVEASLTRARFFRGDLRQARLPNSILTDADLSSVNLFRGSLEDALLLRTDLRDSNLYEAEFLDARIAKAQFARANLKGTKLEGSS